MKIRIVEIFFMTMLVTSCGGSKDEGDLYNENSFSRLSYQEQVNLIKETTSEDSILSFDQEFINKYILEGKYYLELEGYVDKGCFPIRINKSNWIKHFKGSKNIGDIDNDKEDDFVFVLSPLSYCDEGESYYFSNPKIGRIYTESNCCHPNNIFNMGDIDEDGINEIGQYYSSCASRYKRINTWTLKDSTWEKLGGFTFTLNDEYEVHKDFNKLFKKDSKGVFQFLEIHDVKTNGELVQEWKVVNMNE